MSVYFVKGKDKGWRYDFTLKGIRHTEAWFKTKTKAKQAEVKRREELKNPKQRETTQIDMDFLTLANKRLDYVKSYNSESHFKDVFYHVRRWVKEWKDLICTDITNDMIERYLNEVFMSDADTILCVQEIIGYAFHKAIPKPALFFLVGRGSNGKSVFIDTLTYLCGKENVSNVSLNLLSNEIYILDLFGKMVNVSSETPNKKFINTDLVKAVVGGDWVTGRELYKRPSKFKPFAKHYLAMNQLPSIEDNTHGMWRRINVIEFPRTFSEDEMDVELTGKLVAELSGIFNWALEGYKRLRNQKFIFSESKSMQRRKQQYQTESNSALDFSLNYLKGVDSGDSLAFKEVNDCYIKFCEKEGHTKPYPKKQFRSVLENQGFIIENSSKHSNQLRIFGAKYETSEV